MEKLLADELLGSGFIPKISSASLDHVRNILVAKSWLAAAEEIGRVFQADAEELAEGGIGGFIRSLRPFLSSEGVELPTVSDDIDGGYVVRAGSDSLVVYSRDDVTAESAHPGLLWGLASARCFQLINQMLEHAGSAERLFAISGGNDLSAVFLRPDLHALILRDSSWPLREKPYAPTDQYPWFGQPH